MNPSKSRIEEMKRNREGRHIGMWTPRISEEEKEETERTIFS